MRFAYCSYEVDPNITEGQFAYRPVIRIQLTGPLGDDEFWGLLDTGADETYITQEMADFLGIVPIAGEIGIVESASGTMTVQYAQVGMRIEQDEESHAWEAVVGIVREPWPDAILGHLGVLEFFDATFLGHAKEVVLERNQRPLDSTASMR